MASRISVPYQGKCKITGKPRKWKDFSRPSPRDLSRPAPVLVVCAPDTKRGVERANKVGGGKGVRRV